MDYTTRYAHALNSLYGVKRKITTGKLSKTLSPVSKVGLTLCGLFSTVLTAFPAFGAERIIFSLKPFG